MKRAGHGGMSAGVQMALVRLMLGAGMTVCVFLQKRRVMMMKRRNQNRRQDYCQHQKGRYALFQEHVYPLKVYPAFSTAARMSSAFAGPFMVRLFLEALALASSTPGTSSTARQTAASQWLQCIPSTV